MRVVCGISDKSSLRSFRGENTQQVDMSEECVSRPSDGKAQVQLGLTAWCPPSNRACKEISVGSASSAARSSGTVAASVRQSVMEETSLHRLNGCRCWQTRTERTGKCVCVGGGGGRTSGAVLVPSSDLMRICSTFVWNSVSFQIHHAEPDSINLLVFMFSAQFRAYRDTITLLTSKRWQDNKYR